MFNQDLCQHTTLVGGALVCPEEQAERNRGEGGKCVLCLQVGEGEQKEEEHEDEEEEEGE